VDDVQWADPLSLELLVLFMDMAPTRCLIVGAHRPDFAMSPTRHERVTTLRLKPLDEIECLELASTILGEEAMAAPVKNLIASRAGGNPFFVEELVYSLIETGALVSEGDHWHVTSGFEDVQLPETLEAVVTARIDRLPLATKHVLQCASVIGREFSVDMLQKLIGSNGMFASHLSQLQNGEFIEEASPPPAWACIFHQTIVHEVAYAMLLQQQVRQYHESVAQAIEELEAGQLEDNYETLAHHYSRSDNRAKAITFLIKAGEKAERLFSVADAKKFFNDALGIVRQLHPSETSRWSDEESRCHEGLGDVAKLTGDYAEALTRYQQVLGLLPSHSTPDSIPARLKAATIKRKMANVHRRRADFDNAVHLLHEALALLEDGATEEGLRQVAKIWTELASVSYRRGNGAQAAGQAIRGLAMAETADSLVEIADCCLVLGLVDLNGGNNADADMHFRRSLQVYEQTGDLVGTALALNNLGLVSERQGMLQQADDFYRQSFDIQAKMENAEDMSIALVNRGNVALAIGKHADAASFYQEALVLAERIGSLHNATFARLNLGVTSIEQNEIESALRTLNLALSEAQRMGFMDLLGFVHAELARAYMLQSDHAKALQHSEEALNMGVAAGSKLQQALALRVMGATLGLQGKRELAVDQLLKSLSLLEEIKDKHEIGRTCAELATVEEDTQKARGWWERAKSLFEALRAKEDLARLLTSTHLYHTLPR
jgi:tetratricopeptide (TPR) repeat protein